MKIHRIAIALFYCIALSSCVPEAGISKLDCAKNRKKVMLVMPFENDTYGGDIEFERQLRNMCFTVVNKFDLAKRIMDSTGIAIDFKKVPLAEYDKLRRMAGADALFYGSAYVEEVEYVPVEETEKYRTRPNYGVMGAQQGTNQARRDAAGSYLMANISVIDKNGESHSTGEPVSLKKVRGYQ